MQTNLVKIKVFSVVILQIKIAETNKIKKNNLFVEKQIKQYFFGGNKQQWINNEENKHQTRKQFRRENKTNSKWFMHCDTLDYMD